MKERKRASRRSLKSDVARVDAHSVRPEEYEELPDRRDACPRQSPQRLSAGLAESAEVDLSAPAGRRHRTLEGNWPWVADPHGSAAEQGTVKKPNKPFHLSAALTPFGRSARRR